MATDQLTPLRAPAERVAPRLEVLGIGKDFGATAALQQVDLCPVDGELLTILGPSGCGKTTLLRIIAGFDVPTRGEIRMSGRRMSAPGVCVPPEQRGLGIVPQSYAVWPHMSVADNVGYPLRVQRRKRAVIARRVAECLALVGLEGFGDRRPASLSGGQQQRVALARAVAGEPGLLLLDEPLSNLDAQLRERMRRELRAIQRQLGITTILVTHDQSEAIELADRVVVMKDGRVQQTGPPEELYRRPATAFVAGFLGAANVLPGSPDGPRWRLPNGAGVAVAAPPPSDATALVVHPEDLRILPDGDGAVVTQRVFAGACTAYSLRSGEVELDATSADETGPDPGEVVGILAQRAHYLTDPQDPAEGSRP